MHSRCNIFRSIIRNHISDCKRNSWRADPAWGRASDGSDLCTDCLVCDCDYGADTVEIRSGKGKNCNPHGLWWQRISALFRFEMYRGEKRKTNDKLSKSMEARGFGARGISAQWFGVGDFLWNQQENHGAKRVLNREEKCEDFTEVVRSSFFRERQAKV